MNADSTRSLASTVLMRGMGVILLAAVVVMTTARPSSAAVTVTVNWTEIGIYPRSAPSMDSAKVGAALPDGAAVTILCETEGQPVSNGYQTISIWDKLDNGTWLPNAHLDTGTTSWTPGVPRCEDTVTTADEPTSSEDVVIDYEGEHLADLEGRFPLTYALWDHYLWGDGQRLVLHASSLNDAPGFKEAIRSMSVGQFGTWTPPHNTDLAWAVGTFTVVRETENCWAIHDHYDFTPDKVTNWPYLVYWSYQASGAREFDVNSSGCF